MPETVLVISNIAWGFIWQRHQTMAALFAREQPVIFCEIPGIRRVGWSDLGRVVARLGTMLRPAADGPAVPERMRIIRPFVLPATNALFRAFNAWRMRRLVAREPALRAGVGLVFNYSASRTALDLADLVPHRRLVYDCTDDWLAVQGIPDCLAGDEGRLLAAADLTLVPSHTLLARKSLLARKCVRLPHGALVERFLAEPKPPVPAGRLTLLYYGHLHRQHLDFELLEAIARQRSDWRLVLVGPVKTAHPFPANVELPGQRSHEELRKFVAAADVLLLPYRLNDYTAAVMPAKTYECLATGRPIVAAALPELTAEFPGHLRFPAGPDGWVAEIEKAVATDTPAARQARIDLAQANTWDARFRELRRLLADLETS